MIIVLDAGVILKWLIGNPLREPDTDKASAIMESVAEGELAILQPVHWLAEVAAVATRLAPSTAVRDVELIAALELPTTDDPNVIARATSLAIETKHHLFDTLYHAVALEHEDAMLVTADGRYHARAKRYGNIVALRDWKFPTWSAADPKRSVARGGAEDRPRAEATGRKSMKTRAAARTKNPPTQDLEVARQQKTGAAPNRVVAGKKDGPWATLYADGTKRSEGAYVAGVKHGRWLQYHKNGKPATEATFHDGKYVGRYRAFHDSGKLAMEGHYNPIRGNSADGTKDGEFKYYNTDGKTVWRIITYKRGSRTRPDEMPAARDYQAVHPLFACCVLLWRDELTGTLTA